MVMYLDDIMAYSTTLKEHGDHLWQVLQVIRENELYLKIEKCLLAQEDVKFIKVTELLLFIELVNCYRWFIKGYLAKVAPLIDLLKKNQTWHWLKECQHTFKGLNKAISKELVLIFLDHVKHLEVQIDASNFAIGRVLIQEGHFIAFENRKLNYTERRYTVQEKIIAIIRYLQL